VTDQRIGFIGLGAMGAPMAARLLAGPGTLSVFDPVAARRDELAGGGAVPAATAAEAAKEADLLFVMVLDEAQCRKALLGTDGAAPVLAPGAVVVLMSTVGPDAVRRLATALAEADVELVDAPVSGEVGRAAAGDLLIMASGRPAAVERARPALDLIGSTVVVCGETAGDGQSVKLVNQLLCGVHIAAAGGGAGLRAGARPGPRGGLRDGPARRGRLLHAGRPRQPHDRTRVWRREERAGHLRQGPRPRDVVRGRAALPRDDGGHRQLAVPHGSRARLRRRGRLRHPARVRAVDGPPRG